MIYKIKVTEDLAARGFSFTVRFCPQKGDQFLLHCCREPYSNFFSGTPNPYFFIVYFGPNMRRELNIYISILLACFLSNDVGDPDKEKVRRQVHLDGRNIIRV